MAGVQRYGPDEPLAVVGGRLLTGLREVTADLKELRAVSEGTAELAGSATSLADLSDKLLSLPGIESAGAAGLRLNTFAEANCGFSTGVNGQ